MNRRALLIGTSVVAIGVFAAAAITYRSDKQKVSELPRQDDVLVRTHAPIIGRVAAPVTIVEFLDPSVNLAVHSIPSETDSQRAS